MVWLALSIAFVGLAGIFVEILDWRAAHRRHLRWSRSKCLTRDHSDRLIEFGRGDDGTAPRPYSKRQ